MLSNVSETKKASQKLLVLLIFMFGVSLIQTARDLPNSFSHSYINWLVIATHLLILSLLLIAVVPKHKTVIRRSTITLIIPILYLALSSGLLHYQGGGKVPEDFLYSKVGSSVSYFVELHNGLNLPIKIDSVIPIGVIGMEPVTKSAQNITINQEMYRVEMTFKINKNIARWPDKLFVIYHIAGIPMVNVVWLI
jgi:hypothetical protein